MINKAMEIIFSNEGEYSSVNSNDNGAVSVGRLQWHGTRALDLLKKIVEAIGGRVSEYLSEPLRAEITTSASWAKRTVSSLERASLSALLSTEESRCVQDAQAEADVSLYIEHARKLGVEDEDALIFISDIENQGGEGAAKRIIKAAQGKDIDSLYLSAKADKVFSKYMSRRDRVYLRLTGHGWGEEPYDGELYVVRAGDTLSEIGKHFGIPWREIAEYNGIPDPDRIRAGDVLRIPASETEMPEAVEEGTEKGTLYTVVRGDSLSKIGKAFGIAWREIAGLNHISSPYRIYVGQSLVLPAGSSVPSAGDRGIIHKVERGDTLSSIARRYNTTVSAVLGANRQRYRAISADYIVVGWELVIPGENS